METLLHEPIRDVIVRYPSIGVLLAEHEIDCTARSVGTCLLKDVVAVQGLPAQQEQQLLDEIRNLAQHGESAPSTPGNPGDNGVSALCGPITDLVAEHARMLKLISLVPRFLSRKDIQGDDRAWIVDIIKFIRLYTDRFHHVKEEDILFKTADPDRAIIKAMIGEHLMGRGYLDLAQEGLSAGDAERLETGFNRYAGLLRDHTRREEEILFPWLNRFMDEEQKADLIERFDRLDTREGSALEADLDLFVESAEKRLDHVESDVRSFTSSRDKTMERLVSDPSVAISHIILPAGESVTGHKTSADAYFIIIRGMMTVRHSPSQEEKYVQGHIIHMPPDTWMEIRNEGPGTLEMFVVRAPNLDS